MQNIWKQNAKPFWILSEAFGLDTKIKLDAIDCELELSEVFDKVNFSDE